MVSNGKGTVVAFADNEGASRDLGTDIQAIMIGISRAESKEYLRSAVGEFNAKAVVVNGIEPAFEGQAIAFVDRLAKGPRDDPKTNEVPG